MTVPPEVEAPRPGAAAPFRLTPDAKFVFRSQGHAAAVAAMRESIESGKRIIALIGAPGTGKTTLLAGLRSEPNGARTTMIYCPYPALSLAALLQDFLGGSDVPIKGDPDAAALAGRLVATHGARRLVLVIDDAARSPTGLLVDLCRVAGFLAGTTSTLQIVLATDADSCLELDRHLGAAAMSSSTHVDLPPISIAEIGHYVRHRLTVAGTRGDLFSDEAIAEIARHSLGVPRVINQICSRALMLAEWRREQPISAALVVEAIEDCPIDALVAARASPAAPPKVSDPAGPAGIAPAIRPDGVPAASTPIEPSADAEIELPPPPSIAAGAPDAAAKRGPPAMETIAAEAPRKESARASWKLREVARERRLARGDLLPHAGGQSAPRYAGFTARRQPKPASMSESQPTPVPKPRKALRGLGIAVVAISLGTGAAMHLRPDLAGGIARLAPTLRQEIVGALDDPQAALDRVIRFIRPAYHRENPAQS